MFHNSATYTIQHKENLRKGFYESFSKICPSSAPAPLLERLTQKQDCKTQSCSYFSYSIPVKNAFEHEYPYQEATMRKRKYSVSELKKLSMLSIPSETDSILTVEENVLSDKIDEVLKPAFLQKEEEEPKGSARGTIVHKIMELLPFGKIHSKEDLFDALEQVKKEYAPAETIFMQPVYVALKEFL